jgi:putative cell wall-binding protein
MRRFPMLLLLLLVLILACAVVAPAAASTEVAPVAVCGEQAMAPAPDLATVDMQATPVRAPHLLTSWGEDTHNFNFKGTGHSDTWCGADTPRTVLRL